MKNYTKCYVWLTALSIILLFLVILFSSGAYVNRYFFKDMLDTGMDYFNSILYTKTKHPYTQYGTIYPPLANLFYWLIKLCVPEEVVQLWPNTVLEGVAIRGTAVDLRLAQVPMLSFIIYTMLISVLFVVVISYFYKNVRLGMFMGIASLFSYASITAMERGNLISLTICFLLIFVAFYDSDNKLMQEVALICLAIAAGLKLYPAFFGLLLIVRKDWKKAIRAIVYGILMFIVPFLFFDGLEGFKWFWKALFNFTSKSTAISLSGYKIDKILHSICSQFSMVFNNEIMEELQIFTIIKMFMVVILFVLIFLVKDNWKKVLYISLVVINIQNSGNYTLLFILPALILFCKEAEYNIKNYIFFALLCVISMPLPLLYYIECLNLNLIVIVKQYAMLILHVYILFDAVQYIRTNWCRYKMIVKGIIVKK